MTEFKLISIIDKIVTTNISLSLKSILQKLNTALRKLNNIITYVGTLDQFSDFNDYNNIILSWKDNDNVVGLISPINIINKLNKHVSYLIYPEYLPRKEALNPYNMLNAIFKYKLSNLVMLFDYLKINPIYIYQTYILYLNKTISKIDTIKNTDMRKIIQNFIKCDIDRNYYEKLLLFYLKERNIPPFMMDYDIDFVLKIEI